MKTIGQQAQDYRLFRKWNSTRMANEVGTSRQNIETLEKVGARTPHYIADLARVMGTTVDVLLRGEYVTPDKATANPSSAMIQVPASSRQPQGQAPPEAWPFNKDLISRDRYDNLPEHIKTVVQVKLLEAIREEESRLTKQESPHKAKQASG